MKNVIPRILLLLTILTFCLSGCRGQSGKVTDTGTEAMQVNETGREKISVVATVFPYYDFARAVAGDRVELTLLLPPGRDSHSFEPTVKDILKIQDADVFLYNGGEMEVWVDRILEALPSEERLVFRGMDQVELYEESEALEGHGHDEHSHEHEEDIEYDEHIWTSPENARHLTGAVCDILCQAAPQYQEEFQNNAEIYMNEIIQLDQEIRLAVQDGDNRLLVFADRFPFIYFAKEYGLEYRAAFAGCAGDTEPSARTVAKLIELVSDQGLPAVFHVEMSNTKTAEMIREVTGVQILELHSCHTVTAQQLKDGIRYVDLMRANLENLKIGLGKE